MRREETYIQLVEQKSKLRAVDCIYRREQDPLQHAVLQHRVNDAHGAVVANMGEEGVFNGEHEGLDSLYVVVLVIHF